VNYKDISKHQMRIKDWDVDLEHIKDLFIQVMTRHASKAKLWTKEELDNDMMQLRWKISDFRFELDKLLRATFK